MRSVGSFGGDMLGEGFLCCKVKKSNLYISLSYLLINPLIYFLPGFYNNINTLIIKLFYPIYKLTQLSQNNKMQ